MRILIVGGGIAGLSAAVRLRQLGLPATVVEAAPGPRGGGYMIDFLGLGVAAADRLGITPQVERLHAKAWAEWDNLVGRVRLGHLRRPLGA